jgi:hypothetical protein
MEDDPYRTLAEWVLESRGFIKCGGKETRKLEQYVQRTVGWAGVVLRVACVNVANRVALVAQSRCCMGLSCVIVTNRVAVWASLA